MAVAAGSRLAATGLRCVPAGRPTTTNVRIGVLNNLRAGAFGSRAAAVVEYLDGNSDVPHANTSSAEEVAGALAELADRGVEVLVVNGGDGTLSRTLTDLILHEPFETMPLVVPLRSGRTNTNALDIGAGRDPLVQVRQLLEHAKNGGIEERLVDRAVLKVEIEPDGVVQCGLLLGSGVVYRGIEFTHEKFPYGRAQGVFGSTVVIFQQVARALRGKTDGVVRPDHVAITVDGERLTETDVLLFLATGLDKLFFGLRPFWGDGPGGVRFTYIESQAFRRWTDALRILYGRRPKREGVDAGVVSVNADTIELELSSGLMVDGEMFAPREGRTVRVSADRRIRFVRA